MDHHPVFAGVVPWTGHVDAGFSADVLGVLTREAYWSFAERRGDAGVVATRLPPFDEEYFEWIDLLEAVASARERFVMMELGGGWARWLVRGWAAIQARRAGLPCRLIGVEAEPTHFAWMREHAQDNGVAHGACRWIDAAVASRDGDAWFHVGRPADWYGQSLAAPPGGPTGQGAFDERVRAGEIARVRTVSLETLLATEPLVHLVDLDVQGAELDVLSAAARALDRAVMRVHVGTHGQPVEAGLRALFSGLAWVNVFDYPAGRASDTPWGRIAFQDGVQTWVNARLADAARVSVRAQTPGGP